MFGKMFNRFVVGGLTLALALSFVEITEASQGSEAKAGGGKAAGSNTVAKGKGASKGKGKGASKGKGKGMAKGKGKGKNKNHKWRSASFSHDYGTTVYSDADDGTEYYWCQPDECFYPVDYCPYGKYSWKP